MTEASKKSPGWDRPVTSKGELPSGSQAVSPPKTWTCGPGKPVFKDGETTYDVIILDEGEVEVLVGDERVAVVKGPGAVLGEVGALLRKPRSATVRALTPCSFTVYRNFESLMAHEPAILLQVARTLAERLAGTNERIDRVFTLLHKAKVEEDIVEAVAETMQGARVKGEDLVRRGFWSKLGF
ncbi:MAG: Crp/Fnr family transcriptional regulator [Candidatus Sericytochromatia bacterium]|nr:Crp/Fnr family transcriptional regulator [Candidatus Sericytochromatia bacterium]